MRIRLSRAFCTFIFTSFSLLPFTGHSAGIQMVTVDSTGTASGQATTGGSLIHKDASMSGDGGKVVYTSMADNLASIIADNDDADGFSNNLLDIFLWDGANAIVGLNMDGNSSGDGSGIKGHISRNGDHIAFINDSTNLGVDDPNPIPTPTPDGDDHVYLLSGGNVTFLTLNYDATTPAGGSPGAGEVQVDNSGRVYFTWEVFNLVDDEVICDRNGSADLFVYDPASSNDNKIELITISANPDFTGTTCDPGASDMTSNGDASNIMVAPGGQIVFVSSANDLVSPQVESDSDDDVFLWDNGTITMLSDGKGGDNPVISADGTGVAFESFANDMVPGMTDTNGGTDVFLWKQGIGLRLASVNELGTGTGDGGASNPSISGDGTKVTFESNASNISPTDHQDDQQIYLFDLLNLVSPVSMVSVKANPVDPMVPEGADGSSFDGRISEDGSTVAFRSLAHDLTGGTVTGSLTQIYIRDLDLGVNQLLTPGTTTGEGANGASFTVDISSDGRYVLFSSAATDLVSGIDDSPPLIQVEDIFLAEQLGYVEFDEAEYEITETDSGTPQVTVTVNRLKAGDSEASVDFRTDDADAETTATAGVDYTTATGTLEWLAGETGPKTFTVDIIGETDGNEEVDEFIKVILENPSGTGIGNQGTTLIKIVNDDEGCTDGNDNDGDGDVDCVDTQCDEIDDACKEICNNGSDDNDSDSDSDCSDSTCSALPECGEICDDNIDNGDADSDVDCFDADCSSDPLCQQVENCNTAGDEDTPPNGLADCADPACSASPNCVEICDNTNDDDLDGLADCLDPFCFADPLCAVSGEVCATPGDEDGDTLADCADPECFGVGSCTTEDCSLPGDEDGDTLTNCADPDCDPVCPDVESNCSDNVDNDGDGDEDCADSDCDQSSFCNDSDNDGVPNASDNCSTVANANQLDSDGDGVGNVCDNTEGNCTNGVNDDAVLGGDTDIDCDDSECSGLPVCQAAGSDADGDGILNGGDNCVDDSNVDQLDSDQDGIGNACDSSENNCSNGTNDDPGADSQVDCSDPDCQDNVVCADQGGDFDGDTFANQIDNCPFVANNPQTDGDGDGIGDLCDSHEDDCSNTTDDDNDAAADCDDTDCSQEGLDGDNDGISNTCETNEDNCTNGVTEDNDALVDCGDPDCASDPACAALPDGDNDGIPDGSDNCPAVANTDQADTDNDGVGNVCDTVENLCNNGVSDDDDALTDCEDADCSSDPLCAAQPDGDGDGIPDSVDNCPSNANSDQTDSDGDGTGNVCDSTPSDGGNGDGDGDGGGTGAFPPGTTPRGGGGFCQLRPEASGGSFPWNYLITLVGLGAWRLRRKS